MNGQVGAAPDGDECAAVLHELVEVHDALELQPAPHVVGLVLNPEVRGDVGFLPRDRVIPLDPPHHGESVPTAGAHDDHVPAVLEVGDFTGFVHGDVVVGNLVFVQPDPDPALLLGTAPGVHHCHPGGFHRVLRHIGRGVYAMGHKTELIGRSLEKLAKVFRVPLCRENEAAGVEGPAAGLEGLFGGVDRELGVGETEGGQVRLSGVVDDVGHGPSVTSHRGRRQDPAGHQLHPGIQDGGVLHPVGGDVEKGTQCPTYVVVRRGVGRIVVLDVQEHVSHA